MNRRQLMAAVSSVIIAAATTSSVLAQDKKPVSGGTLNVGFISDVRTLDPIQSTQWTERQILFLVFDTLVEIAPDFSLKPALAKSWEFSDDGKQVILKLQEGVKFHDGTPFNAQAVKWNLDIRRDPKGKSSQKNQLEAITDVTVMDDLTVSITMKESYPPLLALLADRAGLMVSPAAANKFGDDLGSHPVGTGPFTLGEWTRGARIDLTKNSEFWQKGMPYLNAVSFKDMATNVIGIQRMSVGELDFISQLDPLDTRLAAASSDIELVKSASGLWYSLQWKWDAEPYNKPELRKAIAHGLNRDRLNQIIWEGKGTISNSATPDGLWWTPSGLAKYEYDPEEGAPDPEGCWPRRNSPHARGAQW